VWAQVPEENLAVLDGERLTVLGERGLATVALHAAAFEERIRRLVLVEPLLSYEGVVTRRYYDPGLIHETVAGPCPGTTCPTWWPPSGHARC
jgi:hypothetical protein